jgi:hypothetical protein
MKTYSLYTVWVCLFISLVIVFLSAESIGDILSAGNGKNNFILILDFVFLCSESVILTAIYKLFCVYGTSKITGTPTQ